MTMLRDMPSGTVEGYKGARMVEVLGEVPADATVVATGAGGETRTLPAEAARREDCIVAYERAGQPLGAGDGPLRVVCAGLSLGNLVSVELKP
jgi:DMSO/TMAO reductase YedYZ molybdopterin-dependent catalytic subunit